VPRPLPASGGSRLLRDAAREAPLERDAGALAQEPERLMLRLLSIRNFVVVEALDLELARGFTVLTGETGAGKSILLDALGLLLGDRFELRQLRSGAERAELAAEFEIDDAPGVQAWLDEQALSGDDTLLVRRVLEAG